MTASAWEPWSASPSRSSATSCSFSARKGNFLKEYLRAFVVYGGTSLVGFPLLPVLMAALNLSSPRTTSVPYLAGAILTAGTVVVSFFGHKKYTFAQATIIYPQPREPLHATAGRDTPPDC